MSNVNNDFKNIASTMLCKQHSETEECVTSLHYSDFSFSVALVDTNAPDSVDRLHTDWGTFLKLLSVDPESQATKVVPSQLSGFCVWRKGTSTAPTNSINALVLEYPRAFDIRNFAPQFNEIERASFVARDPATGAEIFLVVMPLMRPISIKKFLMLKPAIQKWADGNGTHLPTNPACYEVGRFCSFPSFDNFPESGVLVECVSPGFMLDETAFDELMNTDVLTLA